ncbi:MAG: hypothetical protein AB8G18_05805 [Gammaproteobacteria bacterium]
MAFTTEQFLDDCRLAVRESDAQQAVLELIRSAVSSPSDIIQSLGEPTTAGIQTLYHSDDLTVLNLSWGPGMSLKPHNHEMWAVIGLYGGREENTFYRRDNDTLRQFGVKELNVGDAAPLGESIIHGVTNPLEKLTCALHVYGGDFFETPRSEWDPETLEERPYSVEDTKRVFEESNARLTAMRQSS